MINRILNKFGLRLGRHYPITHLMKAYGIKTVLDVGSAVGQWRNKIVDEGWTGMVHSFEANPHRIAKCKPAKNWKLWNIALSNNVRDAVFNIDTCADASSLESTPHTQYRLQVTTARIDTFMHDMTAPFFLKVDAEGHDIPVVKGLGVFRSKTPLVQIETTGSRLQDDLESMRKLGYLPVRIFEANPHATFDVVFA